MNTCQSSCSRGCYETCYFSCGSSCVLDSACSGTCYSTCASGCGGASGCSKLVTGSDPKVLAHDNQLNLKQYQPDVQPVRANGYTFVDAQH